MNRDDARDGIFSRRNRISDRARPGWIKLLGRRGYLLAPGSKRHVMFCDIEKPLGKTRKETPSKKREGRARPVQRDQACSAHRCTQSADNGRRSPEQCSIQATSQCRDQRNNERSHCGLWADARLGRVAAPVAAPLRSGRQKPNRSGANFRPFVSFEASRLASCLEHARMLRKIRGHRLRLDYVTRQLPRIGILVRIFAANDARPRRQSRRDADDAFIDARTILETVRQCETLDVLLRTATVTDRVSVFSPSLSLSAAS